MDFMITYLRCTDVSMDYIYEAFMQGFSDYVIRMDIQKDMFVQRFFGPEGNSLESSFIAMEGDLPVGLVLGGIKTYEGIKTMRCGTLCINPGHRGTGISQRLMELHRNEAVSEGCKQLFLEVIVGNDRAIAFYKKLGYEKIYDLAYFTLKDVKALGSSVDYDIEIKEISIKELRKITESLCEVHINWQSDIDYIEKSNTNINLGAFKGGKLIGAVSISKGSKFSFLWVDKKHRGLGIASNLLSEAAENLNLTKVMTCTPNNASLEGFLKHVGFERDKISQYEMYLTC
jgi:ribosomal protein S18 acetylase RimI-like enzyme